VAAGSEGSEAPVTQTLEDALLLANAQLVLRNLLAIRPDGKAKVEDVLDCGRATVWRQANEHIQTACSYGLRQAVRRIGPYGDG
jgi:hypothetical protein